MDIRIRRAGPDDVVGAAAVHRAGALAGFAHIYPPEAPKPTHDELSAEWRDLHGADRSVVLVAESVPGRTAVAEPGGAMDADGSRFVGVVLARPCADRPTVGELARLYVVPERWGRGVGRRLHDAALDHLTAEGFAQAVLWVLEENTRARAWYERLGWELTHETLSILPDAGIVDVRYRIPLDAALARG
jgi:ribosomal protein S18 acetylase RimI-like enzyme